MAGRGKAKPMAFPSEIIALGSKPGGSGPPKREAPSTAVPMITKKPKTLSNTPIPLRPNVTLSSSIHMQGQSMPQLDKVAWETTAIDIDPSEFLEAVLYADECDDRDRMNGLMCGAVKILRNNRIKIDQMLYLPLMYLAKTREHVFCRSEVVTEAFCSILRRDAREAFKIKGSSQICILVANLMLSSYRDEKTWPEIFLRVYIEDAVGERLWVDLPDCKPFVDNVQTAFNTRLSQVSVANFLFPGGKAGPGSLPTHTDGRESCPSPPVGAGGSRGESGNATPTRPGNDDDDPSLPMNSLDSNLGLSLSSLSPSEAILVVPRYQGLEGYIDRLVMEIVHEQLNRRQGQDNITRNFLKFLTSVCGIVDVRQAVISKLEMWIMNPKISRQAQDLLLSLAANCTSHAAIDIDILANFLKLRFKNKPNINLYLAALRDICLAHKDNLPLLVKQTIFSELSGARNPNNMVMLQTMFNCDQHLATTSLAAVFLDILSQKECFLRSLRVFLREIVRVLRHDINLYTFCAGLLEKPRNEAILDLETRERMFSSIVDLITLAIFLGISPVVRDTLAAHMRNEKKDPTPLKHFLRQTSLIQRDALNWFLDLGFHFYTPDHTTMFIQSLHKLLFTAGAEDYFRIDGWPAENDRNLFFRATAEIPLCQESIISLLSMGVSKTHPLNMRDAMELTDCLVKRAAALHPFLSEDFQVLAVDKVGLVMECLFQATAYNYPETISLPPDYNPPSLALASSYWKAWFIIVLLCAHNPTEFGEVAWKAYPTLTAFMEMCITNQFTYPPPTIASGEEADDFRSHDLQISAMEKQTILDFEGLLAAASTKVAISESNSILLPQLMSLNPSGHFRRPSQFVLEQLRLSNKSFKIGHLLCRSRNPDFLLDILQRQGTNQAMPWLADLVESSEGSLNVLPVQCLCEFLLNSSLTNGDESEINQANTSGDAETVAANKKQKQRQLLQHLQDLLQNPKSDLRSRSEMLEYFLRRLSSPQTRQRLQALRGLRLVLTPIANGEEPDDMDAWLLIRLPSLQNFPTFYPQVSANLRFACQFEHDPASISLFIQFLGDYPPDNMGDFAILCYELSTLIIERSTITPAILPGIMSKTAPTTSKKTYNALLKLFLIYMTKVRSGEEQGADLPELVAIVWESERMSGIVNCMIILAQIILLSFEPPRNDETCMDSYNSLMAMWFPLDLANTPRFYQTENNQPIDLIPAWLVLRMIRSGIDRLVDAALVDVDPPKLLLFVQSFGIPVSSMTKLLKLLDRMVSAGCEGMNETVLDKGYMSQLIEVQHQRGVIGGHGLAKALGLTLKDKDRKTLSSKKSRIAERLPPVVPPRSTALIPPAAVKSTLLHLFDVGSPSRMTQKEKQDTLRLLQKYLTSEVRSDSGTLPMMDATIKALDQILKSELKEPFSRALTQRTAFSCGIFCLMSTALLRPNMCQAPIASSFSKVCETILTLQNQGSSTETLAPPLKSVLENFVKKLQLASQNTGKQVLENSKGHKTYEEILRRQVDDAVQKKSTKALIDSMAKNLIKGETRKSSKAFDDKESRVGLLIDWLQLLDPALTQASPDVRHNLLFSRAVKHGFAKESRPHLLTLMTHQAGWPALRDTIDKVLSKLNRDFDPSAILNFLGTCVFLQKQWQCRDRHVPKHDHGPLDVLCLADEQLKVLIDYTLEEICNLATDTDGARAIIVSRIDLVVECTYTRSRSRLVADYLQEKILSRSMYDSDDDCSMQFPIKTAAKELLLQMYMRIPQCLVHVQHDDYLRILPESIPSEGSTSVVDCISHSLLSSLSVAQQGRQWCQQMMELDNAARKVAATHPILFLRNLPLMDASLKGRTQYDFSFFRSRNHQTLFSISLGLMDLMVPYIFRDEHKIHFQSCLQSFFDFLTSYYDRKETFSPTVDKFADLLNKYVEHRPKDAVIFVRQHGSIFVEYVKSKDYQNMMSIHHLISTTRLSTKTKNSVSSSSVVACFGAQSYSKTLEMALMMESRHFSFCPTLTSIQFENDIYNALEAISRACQTKEGLSIHLMEEITSCLSHPNKSVRNQAYGLLQKALHHDPLKSREAVPALIECIRSENLQVASTAIGKLPGIVAFIEDDLQVVLSECFNMGISSSLDVTAQLTETISTLNVLKGY